MKDTEVYYIREGVKYFIISAREYDDGDIMIQSTAYKYGEVPKHTIEEAICIKLLVDDKDKNIECFID